MNSIGGISRVVVEVACFPLSAEKKTVGFLGGVSWLAIPCFPFVLGKHCLGGLTWPESAGIFSSSSKTSWVELCEWKFLSFPLSGCKLLGWSFLGWSSLQCSCSFFELPFWNLRDLLASLFLQRNFLGGVFLGGVSWLALAWLESAGIFLPQQDLPGWSFVSGNSLVSRCLVASYLGGVSWVEVPCSAPAPSWNSLFDSFLEFKGFAGFLFLQRNFLGGVSWVGYPGWQFFPFLRVGKKIAWVDLPG